MTLKGKEKRAQNQRQEPGENKPGRSILVVRFSSIGDVLLVTPVLRAIRQRWPGAWVSFLTREEFAPLIENNP
ncbi:MAG: hypothetical protein U9N45_05310, partial [Gemmatimonadota bacterium]|nr:hypothetical protein [Gemmatimonadota bacterium]